MVGMNGDGDMISNIPFSHHSLWIDGEYFPDVNEMFYEAYYIETLGFQIWKLRNVYSCLFYQVAKAMLPRC